MSDMVSVDALVNRLKREGLIVVPQKQWEERLIDGLTLSAYRKKVMSQLWLSFSEISKAQLWGAIGQKRVYTIAKEMADPAKMLRMEGIIKIHRSQVKTIQVQRGYGE